jgi:uncharacterized protein (DUF2062 family)
VTDRLKRLLREQLRQGLQPRRLALALALGVTIGVLPCVCGASLLCAIFAAGLGLNQLLVQLVNYLAYPLQMLFFLPYFNLGARLFAVQSPSLDLVALLTLLRLNPLAFVEQVWQVNLQALAAWLLTTPLLFAASFLVAQIFLRGLGGESFKERPGEID